MKIRPFLIPILLAGGFLAVVMMSIGVAATPGDPDAISADSMAALEVQVHLDRAGFSPGILDGRDGQNTATAIYWFQYREGLPTTGTPDSITRQALARVAGQAPAVVRVALSPAHVEGPFVAIPDDIYAKAKLDGLYYESLEEKLSEQFQVHPDMLRRLNPGVALNSLAAGDSLMVPNVGERPAHAPETADRVVVSASGNFVQVLDADGAILYHFPATLGSTFDPSPDGTFSIVSITKNPWWHYQPSILESVPDDEPEARIPPGPNNAVGAVWMELSEPHYGIHGTSAPESIGTATSAGCVRLTNWDALYLASRVAPGTPVKFVERRSSATEREASRD